MSYSQQQQSSMSSSSGGSSSLIEPLRSMAVAGSSSGGGGGIGGTAGTGSSGNSAGIGNISGSSGIGGSSGISGSSGIGGRSGISGSSGIGGSSGISGPTAGVGASSSSSSSDKRAPIRVGFYDIEKTIGKGNFAVVKLARHRLTKTEVAIKIIDKTQLGAADLRRTYREVRVLKKLHHPHIIRLYQLMETKNMLYIVTEYAPQGEIFEHIARHGRLPEPVARRLYWQVVSAVDYCHKRAVVHRDLKAENLLLDMEGSVKLADFGFSTWWSPDSMLSTWCGSPPYAAPEVFEGRQYVGPEVDIWSLGVVLYVLVCGALPFDAATLPALRDRVLSARYRVPYFMSSECESLVRKMLVRDPTRRYTIDQVKRHRWMQADGPPRLLPAPGFAAPSHPAIQPNSNSKQYLDGGLVPDVPTEPNEQILRLMASLGIDSSRTRESLRQQSYDHHAAIYFLLLERLRQHRPGSHRYTGSSSGGPPVSAVRMMSTDSSTCRRTPRRPSTVAENAMRKMIPCPPSTSSTTAPETQQMLPNQTSVLPGATMEQQHAGHRQWKAHRASHCGPSQTSSVDEGVADLDSLWDPDQTGSVLGPGSSIGSVKRSQGDWKWPARGSTSSSVLLSTDLSQTSGSPRESVSGSGTTLSSWDSAWEPGGLAAASLPSCSAASNVVVEERRSSITGPETPLSPTAPNLTSDRLWVPPPQHPTSPTEFRLGRRASDGFMGARRLIPFTKKLDGARAGGVAALANVSSDVTRDTMNEEEEEGCVGEIPEPEPPLNFLCSPAKRPSLPDSWKLLPDNTWCSREPSGSGGGQWGGTLGAGLEGATSTQLHRQLMALRLHRRTGVVDPPDLNNLSDAANARRSVLRQQSYKLAQQQPVLPPPVQGFSLDSHNLLFRPISDKESCLQAHEEEEEEEEEEEDDDDVSAEQLRQKRGSIGSTSRQWLSASTGEHEWSTLPVTMGDCKLTEINSTLSRLSPLLNFSQFQSSPNPSPIPFHWDEQAGQGMASSSSQAMTSQTSSLLLPRTSAEVSTSSSATVTGTGTMYQERMDTSGS